MAMITPPENLQLQSALLRLPAEIKHMISGLCFTTEAPIDVDCLQGERGVMPSAAPGLSLLQTCRRIYHEADRRPLFARNTFRFSNLETLTGFLLALPVEHRMWVQDIEIDMRNLDSDRDHITRGWLQYLATAKNKTDSSLRIDAPGLKCIRINLEAWPVIPMFRIELWGVLRSMLSELRDLERIVVTGASRGRGMGRQPPCSPVHFVGGDNVGTNDLLLRMSNCVIGHQNTDKMVKWTREEGTLKLEVFSRLLLRERDEKHGSESPRGHDLAGVWPLNGSCTVSAYDNYPPVDTEGADK
ncbi:ethyl tert-butyl ether degradation ethd [Pyrenophora seminiperda CCB06]|uniref:Ethyl tert-butyl ether degradation ethd n=1 Tax=Pyrenophora seminiperda CCB06 TaxID=1302712 RepID=A0A3M7MEM1_9PLEO|nr:ethyl tert-butyl ether degradation ethd [Pyrenophora seminiperda CCB06]